MPKWNHHDEHQSHERWVISYADMVTLLFALFVVLYALGEVKLDKLKKVKQSLAFAFNFEGSGQTFQEGQHNKGDVGGELIEGAMILNAQKGAMREFLVNALPEFEETTGKSLAIILSDDSIAFRGAVSGFFQPQSLRLREDVHGWLTKLIETAHSVASRIRIEIVAPEVRIGRTKTGAPYYTMNMCVERLAHLQSLIALMGDVKSTDIRHEFTYSGEATAENWQDAATITFAFSNPDR
jgi:hypothetical protein